MDTLLKLGVVPSGIDSVVADSMHRTTYGVDADPVNLLLGAVKCALADYAGCHLATDLADILFGTPHDVLKGGQGEFQQPESGTDRHVCQDGLSLGTEKAGL